MATLVGVVAKHSRRSCMPARAIRTAITAAVTTLADEGTSGVRTQPSATSSSRVFLYNRRKGEEVVDISEALRALRAYSLSEFMETVELSCRVDMTLKKEKVRDPFRGSLIYPHRFGEERKLLIFAEESVAETARNAGANIVGGEDLILKIEKGDAKFDVCLCTVAMSSKIKHLQKILRANMPSTRRGTVVNVDDVTSAIKKFKQSRQYICDKHGYINMPVGKLDFPDDHIAVNIGALLDAITSHRNQLPKTTFVKRAVLSSTYGPGFPVDIRPFLK